MPHWIVATPDVGDKGERGLLLSQSIGVIRDPGKDGEVGENGGDTCCKLDGLADDKVKELSHLLPESKRGEGFATCDPTTGVTDPERLNLVVDLDVLLLAGALSVSSDSDICRILASRALARLLFSKMRFSTSSCLLLLLSSIISSVTCSHTR